MIYLITKMIGYLAAAGLIGFALGWTLRSLGVEKNRKLLEYSHQDKLDTLTEQHQEELAEFAETAKQSRADLQRLETNNKALRQTIAANANALELAKAETVSLTRKLKSSEAFNKEILEVTGHSIEEFDETLEVREQTLDSSGLTFSDSILDSSLISTQDKTLAEAANIGDAELSSTADSKEGETDVVSDSSKAKKGDEPVEVTAGNLWSHIGQVVGTKK